MSKRQLRNYDKEFKLNAVKLYQESGRSYRQIAEGLGIPTATLVGWVFSHRQSGQQAFPGKGHLKPADAEMSELRKKLSVVTQESDILKNFPKTLSYPLYRN